MDRRGVGLRLDRRGGGVHFDLAWRGPVTRHLSHRTCYAGGRTKHVLPGRAQVHLVNVRHTAPQGCRHAG